MDISLREANNLMVEKENKLEYYLNCKEIALLKILPKGIKFEENTQAGKREDRYLKYVIKIESIDEKITEIQDEIEALKNYIEKELKRLNQYGELERLIIYYKEEYVVPKNERANRRKNSMLQLTWDEISQKVFCSKTTCRDIYRKYKKKREI